MAPSESIVDGRPSSRVLAAPGGASSMASIFGGGEPAAPARAPAPRAPAAPVPVANTDAPVAGSRVTVRTEHLGINDVSSSRVLAAPGGASSMASIFGGGADAAPAPVQKAPPAVAAAPTKPAEMAAGQRVIQRTEHLGINEVASSRVLAAPGGASSMAGILPGAGVEDRKAALMARRAQASAAPFADATNVASH